MSVDDRDAVFPTVPPPTLRTPASGDLHVQLDAIILLTALAGTAEGGALFGDIRADVRDGDPLEPWVRAIQLLRDVRALSGATALWLIDVLTEEPTLELIESDFLLATGSAAMRAAEAREGLSEDESWYVGEGPMDWEGWNVLWSARLDALHAATLVRVGESGMARLRRHDEARFLERRRQGLGEFYAAGVVDDDEDDEA